MQNHEKEKNYLQVFIDKKAEYSICFKLLQMYLGQCCIQK